jgi:hypothetical protein
MSSIKIILYFKNPKYADALARGLCYECTGLDVFFAQNEKMIASLIDRGVLLTDCNIIFDQKTVFFNDEEHIESEYSISKKSPLKEIICMIKDIAYKTYGVKLYLKDYNAHVIEVYSQKGGIGVTSFAITLARILSVRSGKKVLYLSLDNIDDSYKYLNLGEKCKLSREEYFFMKEERLATDIENYLLHDQWGVNYYDSGMKENFFGCEYAKGRILDYIKSEEYFDYIVIDFGKICSVRQQGIQKIIELHSENVYQDLSKESVDNVLKVINFSEYSYGNKQQYYIKKSDKCFTKEAEFVEISMGGEFAQAIEALVDDIDLLGLEWDLDLQFMSE